MSLRYVGCVNVCLGRFRLTWVIQEDNASPRPNKFKKRTIAPRDVQNAAQSASVVGERLKVLALALKSVHDQVDQARKGVLRDALVNLGLPRITNEDLAGRGPNMEEDVE